MRDVDGSQATGARSCAARRSGWRARRRARTCRACRCDRRNLIVVEFRGDRPVVLDPRRAAQIAQHRWQGVLADEVDDVVLLDVVDRPQIDRAGDVQVRLRHAGHEADPFERHPTDRTFARSRRAHLRVHGTRIADAGDAIVAPQPGGTATAAAVAAIASRRTRNPTTNDGARALTGEAGSARSSSMTEGPPRLT